LTINFLNDSPALWWTITVQSSVMCCGYRRSKQVGDLLLSRLLKLSSTRIPLKHCCVNAPHSVDRLLVKCLISSVLSDVLCQTTSVGWHAWLTCYAPHWTWLYTAVCNQQYFTCPHSLWNISSSLPLSHVRLFMHIYYQPAAHCTAIIQVKLHWSALPVKNWRILLVQSFTVCMPLHISTSCCFRNCSSTFGWSVGTGFVGHQCQRTKGELNAVLAWWK